MAHALEREAQDAVRPLQLTVRQRDDGNFAADLCRSDGRCAHADYGEGSDALGAILYAEQRYLVEQIGRGSVRGETYRDKAIERVRRATDRASGAR